MASKSATLKRRAGAAAKGCSATHQAGSQRTHPEALAFLRAFDHPLKREIEAVRCIVLGVDSAIREAVKWNAPSFYTTDHFATFNFGGKAGFRLILHTGAKSKAFKSDVAIADPAGILEWMAKDRCVVTFLDAADVNAKRVALKAVLRDWVALMETLGA